eukprot:g2590.t1
MSDDSQPKRIGGDWVQSKDEGSGKIYYANIKTKETRWEYPEELKEGGDADGEWVERDDPASGKKYYYNTVTRETSWTKPESGGTGGQWKTKVDPGSGKTYYYNTVTRETSWTKPAGMEDGEAGGDDEEKAAEGDGDGGDGGDDAGDGKKKVDARFNKLRAFANDQGAKEVAKKASGKKKKKKKAGKFANVVTEAMAKAHMSDYAETHFNLNRKGIMKGKTTTDKILGWKSDLIKTSLRKLNEDLSNEAVQAFKNVVSYMGDRSTKKQPLDHARKLLRNVLHAPEELRDEIYCQLCKQTTNNPNPESDEKGWQLFTLCLSTFPPSQEFKPYLYTYWDEAKETEGYVGEYASYLLERLEKMCRMGPRREVPTAIEMDAVRMRKPVIIRVFFLDGTFKTVPVEPWTTAEELDEMLVEKMRVTSEVIAAEAFRVFEVSSEDEERALEKEERILDLCAQWQRLQNEERAKRGKDAVCEEYKFVYKVRLFLDVPEDDTEGTALMYIQAVHDVVDARYPCSEQDHITLAALQLQQEHGDYAEGANTVLETQLSKFMPAKFLGKGREEELEERIIKVYQKLVGYTQQEAKLSYLDLVKSWEIYGSSYYFVEPQNKGDFPPEVVLAINSKAILVVDPESKDFLDKYLYSNVVTWGHSASSFVVVIGNLTKQTKIYFKTDQGKEMNELVHLYVQHLIDDADEDEDEDDDDEEDGDDEE